MTATFEIRLVGGPFDGDTGIIATLPSVVFAWACRGDDCKLCEQPDSRPGEVHWTNPSARDYDLARRLGGTPYRRDQLTPGGWWRFVFGDGLAAPLGQRELQRLLEPVKEPA